MTHATSPDPSPLELIELMNKSKGFLVLAWLRSLSWSLYTFDANCDDLDSLIEGLENDPVAVVELAAWGNRDLIGAVQREIARRLHNVVAAAKSLVDFTGRMKNKVYVDLRDRAAKYDEQIAHFFRDDPITTFVHDLRNYCLHYGLPFVGHELRFGRDQDLSHTFFLNTQALLQSGYEWKAGSKTFLAETDRLNFQDTLTRYREKVFRFHEWLHDDIADAHKQAIDELSTYDNAYALMSLEHGATFWDATADMDMSARVHALFSDSLTPEELRELPSDVPPRAQIEAALTTLQSRLKVPRALRDKLLSLPHE